MNPQERVDADHNRMLVDIRVQTRNIKFKRLTTSVLDVALDALDDVESKGTYVSAHKQPAIGTFDELTLARVRKNFMRHTAEQKSY